MFFKNLIIILSVSLTVGCGGCGKKETSAEVAHLTAEIKSWKTEMQGGGRWLIRAEAKIEDLEMRLVEAGKMNQELREQVTKLKADLNASK